MGKFQWPLLLIILLLNLNLSFQYSHQHSKKYHEGNAAFIKFNPFISSLDKSNQNRYTTSDLVYLVSIVATRFSRMFIEISISDLEFNRNTGLTQAPLAVAKYNVNASQHIEVWLSFKAHAETTFHPFLKPNDLPSRLQKIADNANAIFNGTVTTIFIPYNHFHLHRNQIRNQPANNSINLDKKYVFGVTLLLSSTCFQLTSKQLKVQPQIVLISLPPIIKTLSNHELSDFIKASYKKCRHLINSTLPMSAGYILSVPDTNDYNRVNMSRLIYTWDQVRNLLEFTDKPLVLSQAFDTPYQSQVHQKTNGWWHVENDYTCVNISCYDFQEKSTLARAFDMEENTVDIEWLNGAPLVSQEYMGVIFSLYTKGTPYIESELTFILSDISKRYSKVMMLLDDDTLDRSPSIVQEARSLTALHGKIEIMLLIMDHVDLSRHKLFQSIDVIADRFGVPQDLFSTYLLMYVGKQTDNLKTFIKTRGLANFDSTSYKLGITFPTSMCNEFHVMSQDDQNLVSQIIQDEDWNALYFQFEEDIETIKLGAHRTFEQRIVVLEECKRFAVAITKARNQSVELGFIALHYEVNTEFYKDPWRILNFAKYWEMMTEWAGETQTVVILNSVIDAPRTLKRKIQDKEKQVLELEMGWWRYEISSKSWIDKKKDALNKFKDQTAGGLGTGGIVALSLVPFALVLVSVVSISLYRHCRQSEMHKMSKNEIYEFFDGVTKNDEDESNQNVNVCKLPYDKTRFEIANKDFTIENQALLGAGEFGKVIQGKIETTKGKINVAVKMVNIEKSHKSALTGLLSEIKVLGYIGKHDNIVELLGANTERLEQGIVYVFLELCRLGSLEKHLRNIRPQTNDLGEMIPVLDFGNRYVNFTKVENNQGPVLDESLANDLYRWSMEICNGMSYLAIKHVVHADLATRNVLLNLKGEAKICDFGLSRRMYNYTNYVKTHQEPLPWKWMSPESLKFLEFGEKSDVWAFGVVLWEIYSLGEQPYPGLSWDINFPKLLEQGLRMGEPKYNERNMHKIMMECWRNDPTQRPSFADLMLRFESAELMV